MALPQETFLNARWSEDQSAAMPRHPVGLPAVVDAVSVICPTLSKKKLPRPRRGRAGVLVLSSFRKRLNFGLEAKLSELSDQALGFLFNWAAIEIATPEISMFDAVL